MTYRMLTNELLLHNKYKTGSHILIVRASFWFSICRFTNIILIFAGEMTQWLIDQIKFWWYILLEKCHLR